MIRNKGSFVSRENVKSITMKQGEKKETRKKKKNVLVGRGKNTAGEGEGRRERK